MSTSRNLERLFKKVKEKELNERKKKFLEAHKKNVEEFKCDFNAKVSLTGGDKVAVAYIDIMDATELLKQEKLKKQNEKESNNQKDKRA